MALFDHECRISALVQFTMRAYPQLKASGDAAAESPAGGGCVQQA